jgi:protein-disulfide isomerase
MEAATVGAAQRRRGRWIVASLLAVALFGLGAAIVELSTEKGGPPKIVVNGTNDAQQIFGGIRQDGDRLGDPGAPVSIQVFNDLQCSSCAGQFLSTTPGLVEQLVRPGTAQLLYRNYSFSIRQVNEGFIAAEAAGRQGYQWQYAYLFFRNQGEAARIGVTADLLDSIAASIGELDIEQWEQDFVDGGRPDGVITKSIEAQDEVARGLGLRAAPSAIVSGPVGTETLQDGPTLDEILAAVNRVQ